VSAPDGSDSTKLAAALRKVTDLAPKVSSGDFTKLAREQSEHAASAPQGGDLGFLPENRLVPEIAAAVKTMKPGDVVGPIKTAQGLHFIKLVEKKAPTPKSLTEVHDALANALRTRRKQELEQAYLNELGT
jgi:parvulin-like peptidyl-prolyl isomerase